MTQELQTMERAGDGRLTGARGLTEQQQSIVEEFAKGGTVAETARVTGVSDKVVSATLRLAHVQAALHGECRAMLARAAPIAIETLILLASHPEIRMTRLGHDAAKTLLDRTGHGPQKPGDGRGEGKRDLSDLSMAELAEFIQQGQRKAQAVDTEGTITPSDDLDHG